MSYRFLGARSLANRDQRDRDTASVWKGSLTFITHKRIDAAEQPIFRAIDCFAAQHVGLSSTCSWNSRAGRSRIPAEYPFDVFLL